MKSVLLLLFAVVLNSSITGCEVNMYEPQTGDIVFHISRAQQSEAIQRATGSRFSHCGLVVVTGGNAWVLEAIGPVKFTLLSDFINAGKNRRYVARRPVSDRLDSAALEHVYAAAHTFLKRPYDTKFGWGDDEIYCSELVWKAFKRGAGVELCPTKRLDEMNITDNVVQKDMVRRYGNNIPFSETVVSPGMLFDSEILETVFEN